MTDDGLQQRMARVAQSVDQHFYRLSRTDCVFCRLIASNDARVGPTTVTALIEPLNPVTEGHLLVVPRVHLDDFTQNPELSGLVMRDAAEIAEYMRREHGVDINVITSIGPLATQTVMHLHVHLVPRRDGDGLHLPWTDQPPLVTGKTTVIPDNDQKSEH